MLIKLAIDSFWSKLLSDCIYLHINRCAPALNQDNNFKPSYAYFKQLLIAMFQIISGFIFLIGLFLTLTPPILLLQRVKLSACD